MASLPRRLLLQSRQCPSLIQRRASPKHQAQWPRPISTTSRRCAKDDVKQDPKSESPSTQQEAQSSSATSPEDAAAQLAQLVADLKALDPNFVQEALRKGKRGIPLGPDFNLDKDEHYEIQDDDPKKVRAGFWAEGEPSMGQDDDYFGDDITSLGHGELEKHRELRQYARLIAWEMPLLNQLAKPFEVPTREQAFRFRYTSYLGESHPATNKVVVEFSPPDLNLTAVQSSKLIKLVGPRYNPSNQLIKMSCEKFDTQAQNKRFLGETIHNLIAEAKDGKDTFEDIPFDFRHHKPKPKYEFPKEWVLTAERKKYLEAKRRETAELEDQRVGQGTLVDGKTVIDTSLQFLSEPVPAEPVMVGGSRGKPLR